MYTSSDSNSDGASLSSEDAHTRVFVDQLSKWMSSHQGDFAFACGGSVPLTAQKKTSSQKYHPSGQASASDTETSETSSKPISLRWDPEDPPTPASKCKLAFPLEPSTSDNLENLVATMSPATFGRHGKDVYDETYRRALKLDTTQFSTDFCPYELGIIDAVAQILLPTRVKSNSLIAVKAELYKLNIYSGPSGHFRAHVDTPRSNQQFGSLVVCLPAKFEGGILTVSHRGNNMKYDWAKLVSSEPAIHWAAFYSDCKHEVHEVTSGHRVTLTYNLYAVRGNGRLGDVDQCEALDYASLPLYKHMRDLSANESFMRSGGTLGFYTHHVYPHSSNASFLPDALKGLDMAVWNVFQALGYEVYLRPVVHLDDDDNYDDGWDYDDDDDNDNDDDDKVGFDVCGPSLRIKHLEAQTGDGGTIHDVVREWKYEYEYGMRKTEIDMSDAYWLNSGGHEELQFTYLAYGNQAETAAAYSACAILIRVPDYDERKSFLDKL
ncbi:hypothetical protein GGR53DRAFT_479401 [Hypoxylon sp. FL1150]|nr:hypothetical protein GGR53DRAFT_479401 [Hypoxylon sp. FL1150]